MALNSHIQKHDFRFIGGIAVSVGAGTVDTGTQRVIIASDQSAIPASQSGTWNITNVSGTVSLPTGAATAAKQDTIIGHVDGIEGLLTTIDADTGNISTKIDTLAGAVSGSEMQVDVLTMPTVTVNAHAVTNAGTFAVQESGAALTALQLIDDTVATLGTTTYTEATTKGLIIGAVRRDADTTLVDTTNEVGPLQMNAAGQLKVEVFSGEALPVTMTSTTITGTVAVTQSGTWDEVGINDSGNSITVDAPVGTPVFVRLSDGASAIATLPVSLASVPSHAVTNAGTFAVQVDGAALTALQLIDNLVLAEDAAHQTGDPGVQMLAVRQDAQADFAADGDYVPLSIDANGALRVSGGGGGTQYATNDAYADTNVGTLALTIRDDALTTLTETDGDYSGLRVDSTGRLWVNVSNTVTVAAHAVTNAGTFVVQVDGAALTALQLIDDYVFADDAAFTLTSSKVAAVGAIRDDALATLSAVEGDVVPLRVSSTGALHVTGGGGGTEYTSDEASPTDPIGATSLIVRDDALATQETTDGDWTAMRGNARGALWVQHDGNITADLGATDNAVLDAIAASVAAIDTDTTTIIGHVDGIEALLGTIDADTSGIITAVQLIDDAIYAEDVASQAADKGMAVMAIRDDTLDARSGTEGDYEFFHTNANGALWTIDVNSAEMNTSLNNIEASVAAIDTDTSTIITNTGAATTALQIMDDWDNGASDGASVSGDVAHDGVDAGEPVKVGGKATDVGAALTVANNDRTNAAFLRNGAQLVLGGAHDIISKSLQITDADGAQTDTALITVSAGTAIVVTKVSVVADKANTVDVSARIGFGTANTPAADAAGVILFHPGIPAGGGLVEGSGAGIIGIGASNEDLRLTCEDPVTGSINITITYFTIAIG